MEAGFGSERRPEVGYQQSAWDRFRLWTRWRPPGRPELLQHRPEPETAADAGAVWRQPGRRVHQGQGFLLRGVRRTALQRRQFVRRSYEPVDAAHPIERG